MARLFHYVCLALVTLILPSVAWAQNQCNTRGRMLSMLANRYREAPVAVGVTNTGGPVEVLLTGDGNTWTIIVTTPQGMSCLVAAGEGWRALEHDLVEPEA